MRQMTAPVRSNRGFSQDTRSSKKTWINAGFDRRGDIPVPLRQDQKTSSIRMKDDTLLKKQSGYSPYFDRALVNSATRVGMMLR